jgi:hypothetical protein
MAPGYRSEGFKFPDIAELVRLYPHVAEDIRALAPIEETAK